MSTTANASHLLLELLQRGGFAASIVLWRDIESEGVHDEGTEKTTEDKDRARERIRDLTRKREYKRTGDERRRRNRDREGSEGSEGKATNSVTTSPARPN